MKRVFSVLLVLCGVLLAQAQSPVIAPNESLLVWIKPTEARSGQLVLFNAASAPTVLLESASKRVLVCGAGTSADGNYLALYMGGDDLGQLSLVGPNNQPVVLQDALSYVSCVGDNLHFSPDSARVGYLVPASQVTSTENAPISRLLVHDTATGAIINNVESVGAFDLTANGGVWLNFFTESKGRTVEVGIITYDGTSQREVSTIYADSTNDCAYTNGSIRAVDEERLAVVLGYKCNRGGDTSSQWEAYVVQSSSRTLTRVLSGKAGGAYAGFTKTNNVFSVGDMMYWTVPDGLNNDTGSVFASSLTTPALSAIVPQYGQMYGTSPRKNHAPLLSPNGRFLAVVQNDPNNNATLYVVDMNAPTLPPIVVSAGSRGNVISELLFSPDSQKLFYVGGLSAPENNALFMLDLATGVSDRVVRGRIQQGVMSLDGARVAFVNYATFSDKEPPYPQVEVLDWATATQSVLYTGAQIVENKVVNLQEIVVLAWRKTP